MVFERGAVGLGVDVARGFGGGVDEQPPVYVRRRLRALNSCGSSAAWSMNITARAAGSVRPLVPKTLVRLGPLAFQSTAGHRGRTS